MAETIVGMAGLQRRLGAIARPGEAMMRRAGYVTIGQMKLNLPHRTSNTSRSLRLVAVTETSARIEGSRVALWIDTGTGLYGPHHQKITPKAAQALHWMGGGAGKVRLSGRSRTIKGVAQAVSIFARSVKGMVARPYIVRSVASASRLVGVDLRAEIVDSWNSAA